MSLTPWAAPTLVALMLAATAPAAGEAQSCPASGLVAVPDVSLPVDKDTSTASAVVRIRSCTGQPLALSLSVTDFASTVTHLKLGAETKIAAVSGPDDKYLKGTALPPATEIDVKLDVSKLWEAGASTAELQQNGATVASLTALKYRVPFAVKSARPEGAQEDLVVYPDQHPSLSLRNDDAMDYLVDWELILEGRPIAGGHSQIVPPGTSSLKIDVPPALSSWPASGTLQDDLQSGKLLLSMAATDISSDRLPQQEIPIKARIRYFSRGWQQLWNLIWLVLILAVGAVISIALNVGIPNQLKRAAVRRQILDLNVRINRLPQDLPTSLLTGLRVEARRLKERLKDDSALSPNFAADLPALQAALDSLDARLKLVEQVADSLADARGDGRIPPSQMDQVEAEARDLLARSTQAGLAPADLSALQAQVTAFQKQAGSLAQPDPDLEKAVLAAEGNLRTAIGANYSQGPWNIYLPELEPTIKALFGAPATIAPAGYYDRDMTVQCLTVMQRYLGAQGLQGGTPTPDLAAAAANLKALLSQRTYTNLSRARVLVSAVEQNIYPSHLLAALADHPPQASLRATPSQPLTYETVHLETCFTNDAYNSAAARALLTCTWDFGRGKAAGWSVTHYFTSSGKVTVKAQFSDSLQAPGVSAASTAFLTSTLTVGRRGRPGLTWLELLRSGLALLAALLALIAGAQEKIAALPLVQAVLAVLVIGLTADTIKNLLVKSGGS